jgi:DNA-binding beta-propeller fold protein YncE
LDRLYAIVPAGATLGTGSVTVTVASMTSGGLSFTVLPHRAVPSGNLVDYVSLGAARPRAVDVTPNGDFVYVATDQGVKEIDAASGLLGTAFDIPVSGGCIGLVAMPDGKHVLALRAAPPHLWVIGAAPGDGDYHNVARQIDLGAGTPLGLAVVPGGAEVVVAFADRLLQIETPTNVMDDRFGQPVHEWRYEGGRFLGPVAVSRKGDHIFASTGDNHFAVFDTSGVNAVGLVRSGVGPREIAPAPDGESAFGVDLDGAITEFEALGSVRTVLAAGGGTIDHHLPGDFAFAADFILNRVDILDLTVA